MKPVKKTWLIDPSLVKQAQRAIGARTETETVTTALREVLVRQEIDDAFRKCGPILANVAVDPQKDIKLTPRPRRRAS